MLEEVEFFWEKRFFGISPGGDPKNKKNLEFWEKKKKEIKVILEFCKE